MTDTETRRHEDLQCTPIPQLMLALVSLSVSLSVSNRSSVGEMGCTMISPPPALSCLSVAGCRLQSVLPGPVLPCPWRLRSKFWVF